MPWYMCDLVLVKIAKIFTKILFSLGFGSLPTVTLTFDFLTTNLNQQIHESKYIYDQIG